MIGDVKKLAKRARSGYARRGLPGRPAAAAATAGATTAGATTAGATTAGATGGGGAGAAADSAPASTTRPNRAAVVISAFSASGNHWGDAARLAKIQATADAILAPACLNSPEYALALNSEPSRKAQSRKRQSREQRTQRCRKFRQMSRVELLVVTDCFEIERLGLVVAPDFSVPEGAWQNQRETILIVTPTGEKIETEACFNMWRFNIRDPGVPLGLRWRIVVTLPTGSKEKIPVGSRLLVSAGMRDALVGRTEGQSDVEGR